MIRWAERRFSKREDGQRDKANAACFVTDLTALTPSSAAFVTAPHPPRTGHRHPCCATRSRSGNQHLHRSPTINLKRTAMKDTTTLLVLMFATIATGVIAAVAEGAPAAAPVLGDDVEPLVATDSGPSAAVLRYYDADENGLLDAAERATLRADIASGDFMRTVLPTLEPRDATHRHLVPSDEVE
jgi:hypothetical protein